MSYVRETVQKLADRDPARDFRKVRQLNLRMSEQHMDLAEGIAERLKMSRAGLAVELLEAALEEAGKIVGVELVPTETGEYEVGLFDDPREGTK